MATKISRNRSTSSNGRQSVERTNGDSMRWAGGLVLFCLGVYSLLSVFFSFFSWEADQSLLRRMSEAPDTFVESVENPCGPWGVRIGSLLVDDSFGVFGIILPVIFIMLGLRIIRRRPMRWNGSILPLALVMILGSLTLGFIFGAEWSLCSSSGWGGAFGCEIAARGTGSADMGLLYAQLGFVGTLILLVSGWILTGVLINRNFIDKVNSAGSAVVDGGGRIVGWFGRAAAPQPDQDDYDDEEDPQGDDDEDVYLPVPESAVAAPEPAVNSFADDPEEGRAVAAEKPAVPSDDPFEEVDLAPVATDRVVMGAGGLVELAPAVAKPAESAEVPESEPGFDPENPFQEITVGEYKQPVAAPDAGRGAAVEHSDDEDLVVTVDDPDLEQVEEEKIATECYNPLKDLSTYKRPQVSLLEDYRSNSTVTDEEITENTQRIEETLKDFGIPIQKIRATVGPTVTLYEIVQAPGVKISKIQGLQNDIAQRLKAESGIRIIAPIPGKGTVGIEVPNRNKQIVSMNSVIRSVGFQESKAELPVVIGRTIYSEFVFDLAKMPHLLVAGATGQGKSVGLNAIITSLLYRKHPAELKFVMIDPKMVEFSLYSKIERHYMAKMESEEESIVTDPKKAVYTLNSLCVEMDNRLELCRKAGARNIIQYNEKFIARRLNPQKGHRYLPYIVVVIDEFADLIMSAKEVEIPVTRLAQKARAVGIHLIVATQRPSVDVITGKIKANFPARIAFRVTQMIDSRTILDRPGAEQLIGRGDMLIAKDNEITRVQCALVDTPEVERIVDYISRQQGYTAPYSLPDYVPEGGDGGGMASEESSAPVKYDSLFGEIAREAVSSGVISVSMIQRNYEVGFNRAGRIMMQLERAGIVGRQQGAKPRDIHFHDLPSLEAKLQELGVF